MKGRCGEGPPPFVLLQPYLLDEITVGTASEEFGKFPSPPFPLAPPLIQIHDTEIHPPTYQVHQH